MAIHFLCGNRDFLVGDEYCARAGMTRITEPYLLAACEPNALLLHGDTLCTDDLAYQRFRRKVRNPAWQARVLSRPVWWRRGLARLARSISRYRGQRKPAAIMDVNQAAVERCFRQQNVELMIHGHTHRPAVHHIDVDGKPCRRIVLGDWHQDHGSVVRLVENEAELLVLDRDAEGSLRLRPPAQSAR